MLTTFLMYCNLFDVHTMIPFIQYTHVIDLENIQQMRSTGTDYSNNITDKDKTSLSYIFIGRSTRMVLTI